MSRARTAKPSSPEQIARRRAVERQQNLDPAQWGVNLAALKSQSDAVVVTDPHGGARRAQRITALQALQARGAISAPQLAAVDRLFEDVSIRAGVGRSSMRLERIDASGAHDLVSGASLAAAKRIEAALAGAGPSSRAVLLALIEPTALAGTPMDWKGAVARVTGETDRRGQAAILRFACESLHQAYRDIDYAARPRRGL